MKKLMFVAALAASAAAFAEGPINATAFANPEEYNPNAADSYFYFAGESDSSTVTNESPSTKHTANFATATDSNYLALDTEGSTLWRSLNTITSTTGGEGTTYDLGAVTNVAANGTYLDTLVQFTVTEDEAPTVGEGDKLAIWLQAGEGTTNLMVRAALAGDTARNPTDFALTATVEPGTWYRLTVKALADITDGDNIPGFQIYLDGDLLATGASTATSAQLAWMQEMDDSHYADIAAGKYFASLQAATTLQGVGFQGTGAIDEIVWTEDNPISGGSTVEFTLTWGAGISAVSYTIDGTTTDLSSETSPYTITDLAADTAMTVNASAADWYVISSGTGAVTAVAGGTNEIVAVLAATPGDAGATGLPSGVTTADAKAWAVAKSLTPAQIAACNWADEAYLLNTDLTTRPTFAITAIEEVEGGWQITVEAKAGETAIDLDDINGTLKVKTGATLSALDSAPSESASFTVGQDGKAVITITGTGKNFIKAVVE